MTSSPNPDTPPGAAEPVLFVNPLQGSASHFRFSRGNCGPLVARPYGMTHWAPQTDEDRWFFRSGAYQLQGIRATHQPSPWIGDYGHFTVMAQTGRPLLSAGARSSAFRPEELVVRPDSIRVLLRRYSTLMEMTATERCAIFRFTFPVEPERRVILDPLEGEGEVRIHADGRTITGFTKGNSGGAPANFACYFAAVFAAPFESASLVQKGQRRDGQELAGERMGFAAEFAAGSTPVELRIGTSFISEEQAMENIRREIGDRSFDEVRTESSAIWNDLLSQFSISGATPEEARTFYSCVYRANLFPRQWHEIAADGSVAHFSPYDGQVHPGILYTDNGFWDTYRTVYPFLALTAPDRLAEILQGWVNAFKEGGWYPQWASPGYRACMVGTHIDAVMADGIVRGVTGFDRETAFRGLLKHAFEPGDEEGSYGRIGIEEYLKTGFVFADRHHGAVARSLDYAYDDFCISQVAIALGHTEEAARFRERAMNYRKSFDPSVDFMRGRCADGSWLLPFEEFTWGGPYVEGGPWQSTWAVQHDPAGLIELMGGPGPFCEKLDAMLSQEPVFDVGSYGFEIHEMTEMAAVPFGQYAHSNQPVHHVLYLYTAAGRPERTQYWVRQVLDRLYSPDGFCGDEDNGEMSCWYLFSALGLFPLCPGHPSFVLGAPLFPSVTIRLPCGAPLTVERSGRMEQLYVQSVIWNGEPWRRTWIGHDVLANGGTLQFVMGDEPPQDPWATAPDALPFSLSTEPDR